MVVSCVGGGGGASGDNVVTVVNLDKEMEMIEREEKRGD